MKLETFFNNFDLLADAPNGVQKLRELILQLAVMGKLVPQDENDEPASVLLEKIKFEREKLIEEGEIRKSKTSPAAVEDDEIVFTLPKAWQWERLGNLARFIDYRGKTPTKTNSGVKLITAKNVRMGYINDNPKEHISEETYQKWMTRGFPRYGDLLFTTEAPLGNIAQLLTTEKIALAQRVINFQTFSDLFPPYLKFALMSQMMQDSIRNKATGMTAKGIKAAKLKQIWVPIPPLAEQKRIVAKVDELMALCDRLSERQQKRRSTRILINNAAIGQLLTAREPEVFNKSWQHICNNFDWLYSTPDNIGKLRQAILQLAVQGKLVPQDENDEPASVLLEKIKFEKERLVKEGKIKKFKELPPIETDEIPYKLPTGWEWARFPELGEFGRGKSKHRPRNDSSLYQDGTYPLVQTGDVARANGIINTYTQLYNEKGLAQSRLWRKGTLCITIAANIADVALLGFEACFPDSVVGFIPSIEIGQADYFAYFMRTAKEQLQDYAPSTAQKNINLGILEKLLIPLPPLNEQKRIITKVNQLMSLCDALETKLSQSVTDSEILMEAAVRQILTANRRKYSEAVTRGKMV